MLHEPDKAAAGQEADTVHSTTSVCAHCRISLPAPSPQLFSFNGPQGACPRCVGLGGVDYFEPAPHCAQHGAFAEHGRTAALGHG